VPIWTVPLRFDGKRPERAPEDKNGQWYTENIDGLQSISICGSWLKLAVFDCHDILYFQKSCDTVCKIGIPYRIINCSVARGMSSMRQLHRCLLVLGYEENDVIFIDLIDNIAS
jgi:hypothetical protein